MTYCLDTNICIYFLKGTYPHLLGKMMAYNPDMLKIPAVVKAELLYGAEKSQKRAENLDRVMHFLLPFEVFPFDDNATAIYAGIRSSMEKSGDSIGPNDLLIAAIALSHGSTLVTNNEKEFQRVPGLAVENWTHDTTSV